MKIKGIIAVIVIALVTFSVQEVAVAENSFQAGKKWIFSKFLKWGPQPDFPKGMKSLPKKTDVINHFQETYHHFILVSTPEAAVYQSADEGSKVLKNLPFTMRVRAIHVSNDWVFVSDEKGDFALGWMKRNDLAFKSDFRKLKQWDYPDFAFCKNEYCAEYQILSNASFINNWTSSGGGIFLKGIKKGHLFEYKGIIYGKKQNPNALLLFVYRDAEGNLLHEEKFSAIRILEQE